MKIRDYMDPLPNVELIPHRINCRDMLQVKVNAGAYTPYYYVGDGQRVAFVRNGTDSLPATAEEMVRLVLKGANKTFDSLLTDSRLDENAFTILANSFENRTSQSWDKKYLQSFGLVTKAGLLTNAGMLFADDCNLSQSRLYCTRWNGVEKGDALNDAEFKGNILLLLREAMSFIKANTRKGWEKQPNGRKNKPEYAERAVLEACVNHLIHRDYTVMGGEVHLDIYDNRLAFTSPGGMYSGQNVQDIPLEDVSSERRNPVLADVMAQLDYMEKRGSGLKRILDETKGLDSYKEERTPVFKSSASQFMTVIYSMEYVDRASNDQVATKSGLSWDQVVTKSGLSREQVRKLLLLMQSPISSSKMRFQMGAVNATKFKNKYLDPLIEMDVVKMTRPETPNSRLQQYVMTELGKTLLENGMDMKQVEWVSEEKVNRLISEFAEALPRYEIRLPKIEEQYKATLPNEDIRIFYVPYLMKKEIFREGGAWIYETPELYLQEMQVNIWQHYNIQFLMHRNSKSYHIRFSEIKNAFNSLGINGDYAVITSFHLNTFDALHAGDMAFEKTSFGYRYGDVPIYFVPAHDDRMIVMRKELLPRYEPKIYEGPDKAYKLINEEHLLYSNIFNMKEEPNGLGLVMMRDIKFYYPSEEDFHYVKLMVDRMDSIESDLKKIERL